MSATRFGKAPECPAVHTNIDAHWLALALVAEMPGGILPIATAMMLAHGGRICVQLDAEEQRAVRAWKRAVQPRRAVPGTTINAIETLLACGLIEWTEAAEHTISPAGAAKLARLEFAWWRWEAALFAPIARRHEAWSREGLARVERRIERAEMTVASVEKRLRGET